MLDGFFLAKDPPLPTSFAVGHHAKNDPGYFQPRLSQANCDPLCQENPCKSQSLTVGNPFGYSGGGHSCDFVRSGTRESGVPPDSSELLYTQDALDLVEFYVTDVIQNAARMTHGCGWRPTS